VVAAAPASVPALNPVASRIWIAVAIVIALAAGARVWRLDQKNLWLDEGVSWDTARQPLAGLVEQTAGDIHPPLYYVLLKGWMAIAGDSVIALRLLSVGLGTVALLLAFPIARRALSPPLAVAALAWLGVSPHMVGYAQEARMYAATMVAVLAGAIGWRRWIESGFRRTGALLTVIAAATVGLYLHYFSALFIAALWTHLLALTVWRARTGAPAVATPAAAWRRWTAATVAIGVLYGPWVPTAIRQITQGQAWRQPVGVTDLPWHFAVFVKELLLGLHYGSPPMMTAAGVAVAGVVVAGWLGLLASLARTSRREIDLFLAIVCVVPTVLALAYMPRSGQMQLSRYIGFLAPFAAIGAIRGWTAWFRRPAIAMAVTILAIAGSLVWLRAYFVDASKDTDVRPVAAAIVHDLDAARAQGASLGGVLVEPGYMNVLVEYYTRGHDLVLPPVPGDATLTSVLDGAIATSGGAPIWVVLEARWPEFRTFDPASDPRLVEIDVAANRRQDIRLFRVR
jgi:uncharacterized membrane protein